MKLKRPYDAGIARLSPPARGRGLKHNVAPNPSWHFSRPPHGGVD